MTRYQKHMQHIHNIAAAMNIENAVMLLMEDIIDHLIASGMKPDCSMVKEIRNLGKYTYEPHKLKK